MTMAGKEFLLFCLVAIGSGVSAFLGECDVHEEAEVKINVCTLEDKEVHKVDGVCPMREMLRTKPTVCNNIEMSLCNEGGDEGGHHMRCDSIKGQYCVATAEVVPCETCPPLSHFGGFEDAEKCQTTVANCHDEEVKSPAKQTCFVF